jgi:pyocin large subunit-like protein
MGTRYWATAPMAAASAAALCVLSLAACDGAPSANPARAHSGEASDRRLADSAPAGDETRGPARYSNAVYTSTSPAARRDSGARQDAPLFHGKPMWAANKNHTAQENADYHFKRDGDAVGATSEDDFLTKVHAFVDTPPRDVQTLARSNGDKLMYDPKANLFAVVDKDGAPRTLFKPRDGQAYWAQQKESVANGDDDYGSRSKSTRRSARKSSSDDNG